MQEIWFLLLKNDCAQIRHWDPARGASLETYVRMVVDRELGNLRSQVWAKKRTGYFVDSDGAEQLADLNHDPEHALLQRASAEALWSHLMHALPARGQDVLMQLCIEHQSAEQTACALGVDRQVVYNWRHEIRKKTRRFLFLEGNARFVKILSRRS